MIELAVALIIIAILLGSILVPLNTQVESRKIDETQRIIARAREALLGYAAAYGYFPCPASPTSNGQEAVVDRNLGTCHVTTFGANVYQGFLPAASLGLTPTDSQGYLLDGWGFSPQNRIRYAVSTQTVNSISNPFTRINGIRNAGMANVLGVAAGLIHVCNSSVGVNGSTDCGTAVSLTRNAVVVIWSVGGNLHPSPGINPPNPNEAQNPNVNGGSTDRIFVSRTQSGAGAPGGTFDDIVEWISPSILFNRLVQAGQLP